MVKRISSDGTRILASMTGVRDLPRSEPSVVIAAMEELSTD